MYRAFASACRILGTLPAANKPHSQKAALAPAALAQRRRLRHGWAMEILAALLVPALGTALIIAIVWLVIGRRDAVIADEKTREVYLGQ